MIDEDYNFVGFEDHDEPQVDSDIDSEEFLEEMAEPETDSNYQGIRADMDGWNWKSPFDELSAIDSIDLDLAIPFSEDAELDDELSMNFE